MTQLADILNEENILPYLGSRAGFSTWLREVIWGHRIHDVASQYYLFLEFLSVAESCSRQGATTLFSPELAEKDLRFVPRRSLLLRNLLFNNSSLTAVEQQAQALSNTESFSRWTKSFHEELAFDGVRPDLTYLNQRFGGEFKAFARHIRLLQQLTLDAERAPRWTSRFIFPIGPLAVYTDLGRNLKRDRTNFTRTGELVYLMLSRSQRAADLASYFTKFFDSDGHKNRLLSRLLPDDTLDLAGSSAGEAPYLPYKKHPGFDRLAEDLLAVLSLDLPDQDSFEFLVPLIAFHVSLYHVETARAWTGKNSLPSMVCEIVAPRSDQVRRASLASFTENQSEGFLALEKASDRQFQANHIASIMSADGLSEQDKASEIIDLISDPNRRNTFLWDAQDKAFLTVSDLKKAFLSAARAGYQAHAGKVHHVLGRECGLVSKRGTRSYRYAPTDAFLRMLTVTNVQERQEMNVFLTRLYQRYGIVIDHETASQTLDDSFNNQNAFRRNLNRFRQRLLNMGLARQMSDGCTYVENPLYG